MSPPTRSIKRSPFITKSLQQRLRDQDRLILRSSSEQLQKSLESCQKNLSTSTFPETSEPALLLKSFENKLLIRLNQLRSDSTSSSVARADDLNESELINHAGFSIGKEGIVGFKRQLMGERTFLSKSESLMTPMPMSESIKLQKQNLYRQKELETREALSRLEIRNIDQKSEPSADEEVEVDEDDEVVITASDQPDVQRAWDLAYQAGFSRGPGDVPQRI
ncbi:hypothetical protein BY996DRAFT_6811853 [Phakopsora pachyrhizi]|uniref:Uncharacterized protein n=1 Tax=Phakopsora pachyrhizi TaxID=170000 RepID=A0AAV0AHH7_PHAPC|nr:hypothetical protein BY996DRAFT_6811853 [Phakopsora pachyrhizi]CAH7667845.1 hypothetical protein PPACK8108_LOCUS2279 [Phakopsora pachyrhizi]